MEIKIVKTPFQGENTEPKDVNYPNDTWSCEEKLCCNLDGGLDVWFKEIEKYKPDVIYLYHIKSYNEKLVNGHNEEDWIDDIMTSVRFQFKKYKN